MTPIELTHAHLFCGAGGAAVGFRASAPAFGALRATWRCLGGIDSDPVAAESFSRLTGSPGGVLDLFSRDQYRDYHGEEPPADWREATPDDVRRAFGGESPDLLFSSPPCRGFSRLVSAGRAAATRYQALNALTLRGIDLALEAWRDDPPKLVLLENVPGLSTRGEELLAQIRALLTAHGYSVPVPIPHCLGEMGGLAQRRQRLLVVARHQERVPPHLFEPPRRRLRGVGEVLGPLPTPDDPSGGPLHRLGRHQWITWLRLALIPAGKDWRALRDLDVVDGVVQELSVVPAAHWRPGTLGVTPWGGSSGAMVCRSTPASGAYAVADPRTPERRRGVLGVAEWGDESATVSTQSLPSNGAYAVADPRPSWRSEYGQLGVLPWDETASVVPVKSGPGSGPYSIADPRTGTVRHNNVYRIVRWGEPSQAITAGTSPSSGGLAIGDPRTSPARPGGRPRHWANYRVVDWQEPAGAVTAESRPYGGGASDPRIPAPTDRGAWVIVALDGTWHRPITALEAGVLQGFDARDLGCWDGELALAGGTSTSWRQQIGNAVPPPAAAAMADVAGRCLLAAAAGETFLLSAEPVWARPLAAALSLEAPS